MNDYERMVEACEVAFHATETAHGTAQDADIEALLDDAASQIAQALVLARSRI